MDFADYEDLKRLINEYWQLKDQEKYGEFICKLCDILEV